MRAQLTEADAELVIATIQSSRESRFYHRLHGVLLTQRLRSCARAAALLGEAPRTVEYWVQRFKTRGVEGLADRDRPGRPRKLSTEELELVKCETSRSGWNGRELQEFVRLRFGKSFSLRQAQRLLHRLGPADPR